MMEEKSNIFSDLEHLGFKDVSDIEIYKKSEDEKNIKSEEPVKIKEDIFLYEKNIVCPVCNNNFSVHTVKKEGYKMRKRESDFYIQYEIVNPYFYDVWLCNKCGYASMKSDFEKIKSYEIESIQKNIAPKWSGREYPAVYDINIAIERYKLSLLNYTVMGSKSSKKAMNCLKLSWLYRELGDKNNEKLFREQALIGFKDAYTNEPLPIYGMDDYTVVYLIGELNRLLCNYDEALRYFGEVITSQRADRKLKNLALDQKDLIKEVLSHTNYEELDDNDENNENDDDNSGQNKKSFFSRFLRL